MSEFVRYPTWDRWRDLTRFRLACEMSLGAYLSYLQALPVKSASQLFVRDPSNDYDLRCSLDDFLAVLNDGQQLYKVLLPSYVSLIEDLARDLIESAVAHKGVARPHFAEMPTKGPIGEACATYLSRTQVETWGEAILKVNGRSWKKLNAGNKPAVVHAVVVRNLCAHGQRVYTAKAVKRIADAGGTAIEVGAPLVLDQEMFKGHVRALRAFGTSLASAVTNYPGQKVAT